jgi:hypothetical protein
MCKCKYNVIINYLLFVMMKHGKTHLNQNLIKQ